MSNSNWIDTGKTRVFACGHALPLTVNKYWTRKAKEESMNDQSHPWPCMACHQAEREKRASAEAFFRALLSAAEELPERKLIQIVLDPAGALEGHTTRAGMPFDFGPLELSILSGVARVALRAGRKAEPVAA